MFNRVAGRLLGGAFGSSSPAVHIDPRSTASPNLAATSAANAQMAGASGSARGHGIAGGFMDAGGAGENPFEPAGTVNPADTLALPRAGSGHGGETPTKAERRKKRKERRRKKKEAALAEGEDEDANDDSYTRTLGYLPSPAQDDDDEDGDYEEGSSDERVTKRRSLRLRSTSPTTPSASRLSSLRNKRGRKSVTPELASDDSPKRSTRSALARSGSPDATDQDEAGSSRPAKRKRSGTDETDEKRTTRRAKNKQAEAAEPASGKGKGVNFAVEGSGQEDSNSGEESEELFDLKAKDIQALRHPHQSREYKKLSLSQNESIRLGEVVELKQASGRWLGAVEQIRALTSDLSLVEGRPQAKGVSLQVSWLYSREDLIAEKGNGSNATAWQVPSAVMGPSERVTTDHKDWYHHTWLKSRRAEIVYLFDDSFPAEPPNGPASSHPLSLYRTDTLLNLTPSGYAIPALSTPTSTPKHAFHVQTPIPPVLFGVSAISPFPDEERPLKLHGGRDGVPQIPYVRTAFSFEPQFEHNSDEDELDSDIGSVTPGANKKGKGKKLQKKVWPMQFVPHSTHDDPYNPRCVQHYSRQAQEWYNVDDLLDGKHYRKVKSSSQAHKTAAQDFSLELPERTASRLSKNTRTSESAASKGASSSTDDFDPRNAPMPEVVARLAQLADSKIVRGGAFGLTGNAYLVTRAENLVYLLDGVESDIAVRVQPPQIWHVEEESLKATSSDRVNLLAEARWLLDFARIWKDEVDRRVRGVQEGKGLGSEWRRTGDAKLPKGREWVCPSSGKAI